MQQWYFVRFKKHYKYITHLVKIAKDAPVLLYTNMSAVFCFPL